VAELGRALVQEIRHKRIPCGVFKSVPELLEAIDEFIRLCNKNHQSIVWTKTVEDILAKTRRCKAVCETVD
jgi:hypothetical protein